MGTSAWSTCVILGAIVACGTTDRQPPSGGTGPVVSVGAGGSTSGSGGMMGPVTCDDAGVACIAEIYPGDCSAFPGKQALWTFLSYDTTVPGDAYVEFAVRTADTEEDLSSASYQVAGVADMDTELVPPSVPVHLDEVLSPGDLRRDWLELRIMRVDGSAGERPSVEEWDLSFSCEDI